jgi:transposase
MERRYEITPEFYRTYVYVRDSAGWYSVQQIAKGAKVGFRTARSYMSRMKAAGIVILADVYPHRYRFNRNIDQNNELLKRLEAAGEVFSVLGPVEMPRTGTES